jgi:hypothetical protein
MLFTEVVDEGVSSRANISNPPRRANTADRCPFVLVSFRAFLIDSVLPSDLTSEGVEILVSIVGVLRSDEILS